MTEQLIELSNDIINGKIEGNDNGTGNEIHDIMEENEQTSQEETEVREDDEELRELFQAQMERVMTAEKNHIGER